MLFSTEQAFFFIVVEGNFLQIYCQRIVAMGDRYLMISYVIKNALKTCFTPLKKKHRNLIPLERLIVTMFF